MQTLLTITLVIELIFTLGFIIAPGMLLGTFGVAPDAFGISISRLFGSALSAIVVLLWYARSSQSADLHKATVRSMFMYYLISSIVLIMAQLAGVLNVMGWSTVVLHLVLLVAFGMFAFKK